MSCPKYQHLLTGFKERFEKFWGDEYQIDIAKDGESWSDQLIRICHSFDDEYFVRLCEDFWLTERIDRLQYELLRCLLMRRPEIDRISLQSVHDGYDQCSQEYEEGLYQLKDNAEYLCSLEASIYKREFLLKYLKPGKHIWESEVQMSADAGNKGHVVLVPEKRTVKYQDATRRGQSRIEGIPDVQP